MNNNLRNRREFLQMAGAAFGWLGAMGMVPKSWAAEPPALQPMAERLLFVITATGGGSLVDSFLAVRQSECSSAEVADKLIVYPDEFVKSIPGTNLRALDLPYGWAPYLGSPGNGYKQSKFLQKYAQNMAVMTLENTSVNHHVAQMRSINGNGVNGGRTIGEHIAEKYGQSMVLPYVNMATGGFLQPGSDNKLPEYARAETVSVPHFFALGTDGMRGMVGAPGGAPFKPAALGSQLDRGRALMERARAIRGQLEETSAFGQSFQCSQLRARFQELQKRGKEVEQKELITNLLMFTQAELALLPTPIILSDYGLAESPAVKNMRAIMDVPPVPGLPPMSPLFDPFHAQTCLAYLLARFGYSASVTLGPSFSPTPTILHVEPPIAFDYSHSNHVAAQQAMWGRVLEFTDKLATLLQQTPAGPGKTMWDRSLIYIATDFGRDKLRDAPGLPVQPAPNLTIHTGHNLNNGCVLISPLLKAGKYGDVDPDTLLTYGFDHNTGAALTGKENLTGIEDVYSAIAQTLDAPFSGLQEIKALKLS
jgi:hypothetical protein